MPTPVSVQDPVQLEAMARLHGSMQPTPQSSYPFLGKFGPAVGSALGKASNFVASSYDPHSILLQQLAAKYLLGAEPIANTLNMMSYGEPLTTGAGGLGGTTKIKPEVLDAAMAAYGGGQLAKLGLKAAAPTVKAAINLTKNLPVGLGIKDVSNNILPATQREAELAKFLEPSVEKGQFYHGSAYDIGEGLKTPAQTGRISSGPKDAVFVSPDPAFASGFSNDVAVYPVRVQIKNPFNVANSEHVNTVIQHLEDPSSNAANALLKASKSTRKAEAERTPNSWSAIDNWRAIEHSDVQKAMQNAGFDSFYTTEDGITNLGIFDPKKIKSSIGNQGTYDTTLADMNKAEGGSVRSKVKVEDPVMLERKLKLMGLI
jgi:hypothetical protein